MALYSHGGLVDDPATVEARAIASLEEFLHYYAVVPHELVVALSTKVARSESRLRRIDMEMDQFVDPM